MLTITEVTIKLVRHDVQNHRLVGFATIVFEDQFIVRDLKIINGTKGLVVTMPSRYITDHCPNCREKNRVNAPFCNWCGIALGQERDRHARCPKCGKQNQAKLLECVCGESLHTGTHADVAHPINQTCREHIVAAVLKKYRESQPVAASS